MNDSLHQQLPNLYLFQQVAKYGSFQAAAEHMALSRSAVSKKVAQLERHLNQRLLQRSTRKLRLTEHGEALLKATASLDQLLHDTATLKAQQQQPNGTVTISCSTLIAQNYLMPLLPELRQRFPEVTLALNLEDRVVDLIEQGVDIAVRVGHLPDSSLVARRIGTKTWGCFASPDYLQRHGKPDTPAQLQEHACLVFQHRQLTMDHWQFQVPGNPNNPIQSTQVSPALATDDGRALVVMATLGLGIIRVDPLLIQPELTQGKLLPVLEHWQHPDPVPIHLICLGPKARNRAADVIWHALAESLPMQMENNQNACP
ncbi:MAG: LysR substrate-binding domain-containing protein [Pseudomonadales bacterium]|nr:LysR substrate-binding domain-containing protein [Pseudomonadales bacterium]